MLYILDDDLFNAIELTYKCDFIIKSSNNIKHYKNENDIDFKIEDLQENDIVCFHNSFPCDKTLITNRLIDENEAGANFKLLCFSGAADFYNLVNDNNFVKIHKDRFYHNLKNFVSSNFDLNILLFGEYNKENELSIIQRRIYSTLFSYPGDSILPINEILPRDLRRICDLTDFKYEDFFAKISEFNIDKFKRFLNVLIQNK